MSTNKKSSECKKYFSDLTRYVTGDFDRINDMDKFKFHLEKCPECKKDLSEFKEIVGILRGGKTSSDSKKGIENIIGWAKLIGWAKQEIEKGNFPKRGLYPDVSPLVDTGKDYLRAGKYDIAIKNFEEALLLNPKDGNAWYFKGIVYYALGQDREALKSFNKSIKNDCVCYLIPYYIGRLEERLKIKENPYRLYWALDKRIKETKKEIEKTKKISERVGKK